MKPRFLALATTGSFQPRMEEISGADDELDVGHAVSNWKLGRPSRKELPSRQWIQEDEMWAMTMQG